MANTKRFLVEVGMKNLPFPMRVASRVSPGGQSTIGSISVTARIAHEFEARWIDKFIQILHQHRNVIGTKTVKANIVDYMKEFNDAPIVINFEYPFFVEKLTPSSKEKCLVRYQCVYSVKASSVQRAKAIFKIEVPIVTTYPQSSAEPTDRPFGQLSVVTVEVESNEEIFPEDIVDIVDNHALAPVYSYLTAADQDFVIQKVRSSIKSSVVTVDEIKEELAHNRNISWYSVHCANFGMLHSYNTFIATEKSSWVPFSGYEDELDRESGML